MSGASPYATGGGGVTLERAYGATLLSALLLGDPIPGLGDGLSVTRVDFQAAPSSPVDDFLVYGTRRSGFEYERRLSVAVRRNPTIGSGDSKFVKLLGDFIQTKLEHGKEIASDQWRLALVVAAPHAGAEQTAKLSDLARKHLDRAAFRDGVGREAKAVISRLELFEEAVDAAVVKAGFRERVADLNELTFELLRALRVFAVRLEGDEAQDRTSCVSRLKELVGEAADAESLFGLLTEVVSEFAPNAAAVDAATLRRTLAGRARIARSGSFDAAWAFLSSCESALRDRTRSTLTDSAAAKPVEISLPRARVLDDICTRVRECGGRERSIVLSGAPEVGKSAMAVAVVDRLRKESAAAVALSLRDLPSTIPELERLLGGALGVVLGNAEVAPVRMVVLDGAEVVHEGSRRDVFQYVVRAALAAGLTVVAVTRDDANAGVLESLRAVTSADSDATENVIVPPFDSAEVAQVANTFPALKRLASDPRSAWLLSRPGLTNALLQQEAYAALPDGALSEADVFAAVWSRVVRRGEQRAPDGSTPDGRESTLMGIAQRALRIPVTYASSDPAALASLRSDGLLLSRGPTAAWRQGDEFGNDFIRDLAVARVVLCAGDDGVLEDAGAPRWSLRAARLACQASFIEARDDLEQVRLKAQARYDILAEQHGERWAEIPWEAVLALGASRRALEAAVSELLKEGGHGLAQLVRILRQRFTLTGFIDARTADPVVEFMCDHRDAISILSPETRDATDELIADWLASLALRARDDASSPLRRRVRDEVLLTASHFREQYVLRCLGRLGPDVDARAEAVFRNVAAEYPHLLAACVEDEVAALSLAAHRADLLLELSVAYYFERRDRRDRAFGGDDWGEGIRDHAHASFGLRLAGWHRGPFWWLLQTEPVKALGFINAMLNRAARWRVASDVAQAKRATADQLPGISIELPVAGMHRFVGDANVWAWFRGAAGGPYPCISALLAVERFTDGMFAQGVPISRITELLLRGCENLAMPGLLVGFLVRHRERVEDALDPWLANPEVWSLEFARATTEGVLHAQGPDASDLVGRDRRAWTFVHVSQLEVAQALLAQNQRRLDALAMIGKKLTAPASSCAAGLASGDADPESSPEEEAGARAGGGRQSAETIRGWASFLDSSNYRVEEREGRTYVSHVDPEEVAKWRAAQWKTMQPFFEATRLVQAYRPESRAAWPKTLVADLAVARTLTETQTQLGEEQVRAAAAVAAAALSCHSAGELSLPADDIRWSVDVLVQAARSTSDDIVAEVSVFPWGADRVAARGLPHALVLGAESLDPDRRRAAGDAVKALSTAASDEVRRFLASELGCVWVTACRPSLGGPCVHAFALDIVRESARVCVRRRRTPGAGAAEVESSERDVESQLRTMETKKIAVTRLAAPIFASNQCARANCCVSAEAARLRNALLEAHRRGRLYFARENYTVKLEDDRLVAAVLLDLESAEPLIAHVRAFASEAHALSVLLHQLSTESTYDIRRRRTYRAAWPAVMRTVLEEIEAGRGPASDDFFFARALADIIPHPSPTSADPDMLATIRSAADGWPSAREITSEVEHWIPHALGRPECVDSLISLLKIEPVREQASMGLTWVAALVQERFEEVAGRSFLLPEWLEDLWKSGQLAAQNVVTWRRFVDGLAAAGDHRALRLQASMES